MSAELPLRPSPLRLAAVPAAAMALLLAGDGTAGDLDEVWFSAGPGNESHGLLGTLRSVRSG